MRVLLQTWFILDISSHYQIWKHISSSQNIKSNGKKRKSLCQSLHQGLLHRASSSTETQQCLIHAQHAGLQCAHFCSKMKKSVITHNVPSFSYAALLYLFFSRSYFWLWCRTPSNKKCCKTRGSYWDVHTAWQWQACVQLGYFLQWRMPNPFTFFI